MAMKFEVERFVDSCIDSFHIIITEDYRGYEISIATTNYGDKPNILVYNNGKAVTEEFECYTMGEIYGSMESIRAIMNEIDERENK